LKISPGRFDSLYGVGRAAEMLKMSGKAYAYFNQLVTACAGTGSSRLELAYALAFLTPVAKRN
jgi:hypothetical protein